MKCRNKIEIKYKPHLQRVLIVQEGNNMNLWIMTVRQHGQSSSFRATIRISPSLVQHFLPVKLIFLISGRHCSECKESVFPNFLFKNKESFLRPGRHYPTW